MRLFRDEVAAGRVEKETELRHQLGLVPDGLEPNGRAEINAGRHRREEDS
jgi:hypothetical protein